MDRSSPFRGINVYLSSSPKDQLYRERLRIHLRPMEKSGLIRLWDESSIPPGSQHQTEIERMIALADVAVLLVSVDFLALSEITDHMLPLILDKLLIKTISILPVIVGSCDFQHSPLAPYTSINDLDQPLKIMNEGEVELVWQKVVRHIRAIQQGDQKKNKFVDAAQPVMPALRQPKQVYAAPAHHLEQAKPVSDEVFVDQFSMELNSPEMMQLADALLSGFPATAELKLLISYELHENAEVIAPGSSLAEKVHSLVVWAISNGKVEALIRGALKRNPGNFKLREVIMELNGPAMAQLADALLNGYPSTVELKLLVAYELHENMEVVASGSTLAERVHSLVVWAKSGGKVKELIDGALKRNPGNPALRKFATEHGF